MSRSDLARLLCQVPCYALLGHLQQLEARDKNGEGSTKARGVHCFRCATSVLSTPRGWSQRLSEISNTIDVIARKPEHHTMMRDRVNHEAMREVSGLPDLGQLEIE